MPDDVRQALERFQRFIERHPSGGVIDEESGFTSADGMLLAGEIESASARAAEIEENPID